MGVVVERYALSPVAAPAAGLSSIGLLGLVGAICLLSLSSFFMLRRLVLQAIEKSLVPGCHDDLTGLPNRHLFKDRLERTLAYAFLDWK